MSINCESKSISSVERLLDEFKLSEYEKSIPKRYWIDWCLIFLFKYIQKHKIEKIRNIDYRIKVIGTLISLNNDVFKDNLFPYYILCLLFYKLPITNELIIFLDQVISEFNLRINILEVVTILNSSNVHFNLSIQNEQLQSIQNEQLQSIQNEKLSNDNFLLIKNSIVDSYAVTSIDFIRSLIYNSEKMKDDDFLSWVLDSLSYFYLTTVKLEETISFESSKKESKKNQEIMKNTIVLINTYYNKLSCDMKTKINKVIKLIIKKFEEKKVDDSHGLYHAFNIMINIMKIIDKLDDKNISDEYIFISLISGLVHDVIDYKYSNYLGGNKEEQEMEILSKELSEIGIKTEQITNIQEIITNMSYSKIKKNGVKEELQQYLPFNIVVTADLLCGYDVERCMIYNYNKILDESQRNSGVFINDLNNSGIFVSVYNHTYKLFEERALKHITNGEIRINSSTEFAFELSSNAIEKLAKYKIMELKFATFNK